VISAFLGLLAAPSRLFAASLTLLAYGPDGKLMDSKALLAHIGRADRDRARVAFSPVSIASADGLSAFQRGLFKDAEGGAVRLAWQGTERIQFTLPWPVAEDGFSTLWADKKGDGYGDGEKILLNEELALSQYAAFRAAWDRRTKDWSPKYKPGSKAAKLAQNAKEAVEEALKIEDQAKRAAAFDEALHRVSSAWQKTLVEHGIQLADRPKAKDELRFGLTLDSSFANATESYRWVAEKIAKSGANWVRLVFRANPNDFIYAERRSFAAYDSLVEELQSRDIHIMGCVLDTGQWPRDLTPGVYAERAKNLAIHFRKIKSWEVGSEINGDWLGGPRTPLGLEKVFRIYSEGAAAIKKVEPALETVATLYWWDGTAPDPEHSLFGWLKTYVKRGFGKDLDVVSISLQPEDNPLGLAFERVFERLHEALPAQKLMVGNLGYVEKEELSGYWWFDPKDVDSARGDLLMLYTPAACAAPNSLCGGFWWQTLQQMILPSRKVTALYRVYAESLEQVGR
jgi:hypothetical protein